MVPDTEVPMVAHTHTPLREFAVVHPYASEWLLLALGTLAGLLLWFWNS